MIVVSLLLGWMGGWLVNYLADVLPVTRSFSRPVCPRCQTVRKPLDYLFLRKCGLCGARRTFRAWAIQALLPIISLLLWLFPRPFLPYPLALLLVLYFGVVAVIDLEYRAILHPVSLFGALLGFGTGVYLRGGGSLLNGVTTTLIGGAAGFAIMLVFYLLGEAYVRRMAKKKGLPADEVALGFGDVNLAGIIGLVLGWPAVLTGLFFAILAGGFVSLLIILVMLMAKRYQAFTAIPYAPFLILGALYLLFTA
jgi:leader peptidase (prepilin peptidase)/N-methyltransferase